MLYNINSTIKLTAEEMTHRLNSIIRSAFKITTVMDNGYVIKEEDHRLENIAKPYMYYYDPTKACEWTRNPNYDLYIKIIEEDE